MMQPLHTLEKRTNSGDTYAVRQIYEQNDDANYYRRYANPPIADVKQIGEDPANEDPMLRFNK